MNIKCENPHIIFNPNLKWLVCKVVSYAQLASHRVEFTRIHRWNRFPWSVFYDARSVVTLDNIDDYFLVDPDGVTYPVFMAVPCGHCRLCCKKKVDDWCTRCMCESAASDYPPLFITLTYKPSCRPNTGDECKRQFQLFMKRLRSDVARDLHIKDAELRFFARSEKTPINHYWHIHMLLWNMPYVSIADGDRNSFQSLIRFVQDAWSYGIVRVERCRDTSGAYVMKYALKESDPEYWQLSSRRRGIGYKFAERLLPEVMKHPDITSFQVSNGMSISSRAIPAYFKRVWFPTLSILFPARVSKALRDFMDCAVPLHYFMFYGFWHHSRAIDIEGMVHFVSEKYKIMHIDFDDDVPNYEFMSDYRDYIGRRESVDQIINVDTRSFKRVVRPIADDGVLRPARVLSMISYGSDSILVPSRSSLASIDTSKDYFFRLDLIKKWSLLKRSFEILMKYQFNEDEFKRRLSFTELHQNAVRTIVGLLPSTPVEDLVRQCEIDDNWILTHWMQSEIG